MSIPGYYRIGFIAAAVLVLAGECAIDARSTLAAYLAAWTALAAIPIGALGILMVTYLVRWNWTPALHAMLVSSTAALPVLALLFIPVLAGMTLLYPAAVDSASLPPFKAFYLAPPFFAFRSVGYFTIWSLLAFWLRNAWNDSERMTRAASVGLIVYTLSVSLAGIDWGESLEPDFHSSIYGLLFVSFSMLDGLAFAIGAGLLLRRRIGRLKGYSALLLSTVLMWAYLHAMQYIVIWSGNIPAEVIWYMKRSTDGWQFVLIILSIGQFVFPFFALLSEAVRGDRRWLLGLCGLTLAMRCGEAAILILPAIPHISTVTTCVTLVTAFVLVGMALWWTFGAALENGRYSISFLARAFHAETK